MSRGQRTLNKEGNYDKENERTSIYQALHEPQA